MISHIKFKPSGTGVHNIDPSQLGILPFRLERLDLRFEFVICRDY